MEYLRANMDGVSLTVFAGVLLDYLPEATALLTFVWIGLRVYREIREIREKKSE